MSELYVDEKNESQPRLAIMRLFLEVISHDIVFHEFLGGVYDEELALRR